MDTEGSAVAIGIDAAVVANHHVMVRRREAQGPGTIIDEFKMPPTLAKRDCEGHPQAGQRRRSRRSGPTS